MHSLLFAAAVLIHQSPAWGDAPPLPTPVSNNAVVAVVTDEGPAVFSFLGIDTTRAWSGVTSRSFRWTVDDGAWTEVTPVPGPGRLAATAQAVGDRVFLFGGYTVAEDGSESSLPNVDVYDPDADAWSRGADIPVPVDDAVSGVWRDSLVFLVSGWHDSDNVALVQVYDPGLDRWSSATPIPGIGVFGHAGTVSGDAIVYLGGARVTGGTPRYAIEGGVWRGDIDPTEPTTIRWRAIDPPPGPPLYRAAAASLPGRVVVAGGTDNPYNYNGIGYDGAPATPTDAVFQYDVASEDWQILPDLPVPSMDHRNLAVLGDRVVLPGGMVGDQQVTDRTVQIRLEHLTPDGRDSR